MNDLPPTCVYMYCPSHSLPSAEHPCVHTVCVSLFLSLRPPFALPLVSAHRAQRLPYHGLNGSIPFLFFFSYRLLPSPSCGRGTWRGPPAALAFSVSLSPSPPLSLSVSLSTPPSLFGLSIPRSLSPPPPPPLSLPFMRGTWSGHPVALALPA